MFRGAILPAEGDRVGALLQVVEGAIVAQSDDGRVRLIRFSECTLEHGGHDGRLLFCRSRSAGLVFICCAQRFLAALGEAAGPWFGDQVEQCLMGRARRCRLGLVTAAGTILTVALVVIAASIGLRTAVDAGINALPISVDQVLGDAAWAVLASDLGVPVEVPAVIAPLQSLVDRLSHEHAGTGFTFRRHVVANEDVNEFTAGASGGEVVFSQPFPGDIECLTLAGETLYLHPGAYIASEPGVLLGVGWAGVASFAGGEGLMRLKVTGRGRVWFGAYGAILSRTVAGEYVVDTVHLVAYEPGLRLSAGVARRLFDVLLG